ncbi:MAG TPA: M10 family metallopeptidase C-terminal domain-containing protein [Allosphingosinicella sp.]|nr:M10 family metallopeptidase C-terminal domain-containing protein [Allosphingosinicella sp.]
MSARDRSTIASNSASITKQTALNCLVSENMYKSLLEPFSFSDSYMASADPALRVPATLAVPSTVAVTGTIDPAGDFDTFSISVIAGQTYMVSVRGSGANPLADTILYLLDDDFNLVDADDDGGAGFYSLLTFTAAYTGDYFVDVEGFSNFTGDYTLDVIVRPATDVVDSTFGNAVLIGEGVTFGFIDSDALDVYEFAGETDTYKFVVEAGKYYTIEVAGGADYNSDFSDLPFGEIDPYIFVYGPDGTEIAQNDDISFPSDISSRVSFFASEDATYYLDVQSYYPYTGGYSITVQELDLGDFSPLDAINWFSADNIDIGPGNIVKVYFAEAGQSYDELADNGVDPLPSFGWNAWEKQQVMNALNSEFGKILGVTYVVTTNEAEAEFRLITTTSNQYGAYFYPQDPSYGDAQGIGVFNVDNGGWNFDVQQGLTKGGYDYAVVLHEFGHAHGLAHPHDNGGGSDILLGVTASTGSYGVYDLNQGVYMVMSYNDAWDFHPDGPSPFTVAGIDNGWSGTLSAFDIAVLQSRYGVHAFATGNDVYQLKDVQAQGTYYSTIWDTGGTDEIRYSGARNTQIDLTAATLDYSATGGGVVSFVDDIKGGYTIANGVVIENATAGSGDDVLIGNSAANVLKGNDGDDFLMGKAGGDTLNGGGGFDTASYRTSAAGVTVGTSGGASGGDAAGDTLISIEGLEGSEFADTLNSGNNGDTLSGLGGADKLNGGNGDDTLEGGAGNDTLDGGNHDDTLDGGDGDDALSGGNNDDVLDGGNGVDTLDGGNHADILDGGAGNDNLSGGNHADTLNGGAGNDVLTGGNHNDLFLFTETGGADRIVDFNRSQGDKINLDGIDAVAGGADNAFTFIGAAAFSGVAGQLRSYTSGSDKFLAGDVNGDGVADFTIQTNVLIINSDLVL